MQRRRIAALDNTHRSRNLQTPDVRKKRLQQNMFIFKGRTCPNLCLNDMKRSTICMSTCTAQRIFTAWNLTFATFSDSQFLIFLHPIAVTDMFHLTAQFEIMDLDECNYPQWGRMCEADLFHMNGHIRRISLSCFTGWRAVVQRLTKQSELEIWALKLTTDIHKMESLYIRLNALYICVRPLQVCFTSAWAEMEIFGIACEACLP